MFAPKVSAKCKAVTSGRLTGAVKVNKANVRGTPKSRREATYSLYSEDAEDQVVTLHKGLDRCAALLSDILQCENQNPGAVPKKQDRGVKDGGTKYRPHTPTGKKAIRRSVSKSGASPRNIQMICKKSSSNPTTTTPQRRVIPHSGVSLHPPVRKPHLQKTPSKPAKTPAQPLCSASLRSGPSPAPDCVPEGDEGDMRRAEALLGELKTLMAGYGDSAQTYLYFLDQILSSALPSEVSKIPTEQPRTDELRGLQNHNEQLQRQVMVLQHQIQEQEAAQQLLNSQVSSLQEQLCAADKELTQVQNTLKETESRRQSGQQENISIKTELESTRGRLTVTLQDRFKLEETLQQKQQEIEALHRIIDSFDSSTPTPDNPPAPPPGGAKEHLTHYLLSLEQSRPTRAPSVESAISDWSVQSESSFNTRDEAAFRDGLAALDASIASLQKTLQLDLVKT